MTLSLDAMQAGECVWCSTQSGSEYWLLLMGGLVASVYRKGKDEQFAKFIEKRRMSNRMTLNDGFTMFDWNKQPITAIIPVEMRCVKSDTIPFPRST